MNRLRHQIYKNENTETKYLSNIQNNIILNVNNNLLQLEKGFKELRDGN